MVVRLNLHQDVHGLFVGAIFTAAGDRKEATSHKAFDHCGVVLVGRQDAFAMQLVGVLDHAEQALVLRLAIDIPAGIEDLVPAVLGVGLGEHHQLDVAGVTLELLEAVDQIVDLVISQCQAEAAIGLFQCRATATEDVHTLERLRLAMTEQIFRRFNVLQHALGHAVMQYRSHLLALGVGQLAGHVIGDTPFQSYHRGETTVVRYVRGLAGPGRNGAKARHHQKLAALGLFRRDRRAIPEDALEHLQLRIIERLTQLGKVHELGIDGAHAGDPFLQSGEELVTAELRKGWGATQCMHAGYGLGEV